MHALRAKLASLQTLIFQNSFSPLTSTAITSTVGFGISNNKKGRQTRSEPFVSVTAVLL